MIGMLTDSMFIKCYYLNEVKVQINIPMTHTKKAHKYLSPKKTKEITVSIESASTWFKIKEDTISSRHRTLGSSGSKVLLRKEIK